MGVPEFGQQGESLLLLCYLDHFGFVHTVHFQNGRHENDPVKSVAGDWPEDQVAVDDSLEAQSGYGCDDRDSCEAVRVWARIE